MIYSSEDHIDGIKYELSNLRKAKKLLDTRLSDIYKFKRFQRSLIALIRQLPDELMTIIFTHGCEGVNHVGKVKGAIWTLQQACAHWRYLVRSIPLLWSTFKVDVTESYTKSKLDAKGATMALQLRSCLELSGNFPLSATIEVYPTEITHWTIRAVEDVARHTGRWKFLQIPASLLKQAADKTMMETIIKEQGLGLLRTLIVKGNPRDFEDSPDISTPFYNFHSATALEEVKLFWAVFPGVSVFPWTNVKRLVLQACWLDIPGTFTSTLCAMPFLEELTWAYNETMLQSLSRVITLPLLRTPTIEDTGGDVHEVWSVLRLPSLTSIQYQDEDWNPPLSFCS